MRQHSASWWLVLFAVILAVIIVFASTVQSGTGIDSTAIRVYRDGQVHLTQILTLDTNAPQAQSTLLCADIDNIVVLDENQVPIDYGIEDEILIIYSLGASKAKIEYDTNTLTSKANEVWTLQVDNPYDLTVIFPVNSTIIYLSGTPSSIETLNNEVSLHLSSGQWEISYLLALFSEQQTSPTPQVQNSTDLPIEYLVIIVTSVAVVAGLGVILFWAKRKPSFNIKKALHENPQLMKEDKAVLQFLAEKDGSAFEAEIRQQFPDMPRTSLWRLVKRLEKLELVEVKKVGLENQVILKK